MPNIMDLLSGALSGVAGAIDPTYGLGLQSSLPTLGQGLQSMLPSSLGGTPGASSLFEPYTAAGRPHRFIGVSPTTGRITWFGPLGAPKLFSGDFAACKRVRRVAGHARRRVGGR